MEKLIIENCSYNNDVSLFPIDTLIKIKNDIANDEQISDVDEKEFEIKCALKYNLISNENEYFLFDPFDFYDYFEFKFYTMDKKEVGKIKGDIIHFDMMDNCNMDEIDILDAISQSFYELGINLKNERIYYSTLAYIRNIDINEEFLKQGYGTAILKLLPFYLFTLNRQVIDGIYMDTETYEPEYKKPLNAFLKKNKFKKIKNKDVFYKNANFLVNE